MEKFEVGDVVKHVDSFYLGGIVEDRGIITSQVRVPDGRLMTYQTNNLTLVTRAKRAETDDAENAMRYYSETLKINPKEEVMSEAKIEIPAAFAEAFKKNTVEEVRLVVKYYGALNLGSYQMNLFFLEVHGPGMLVEAKRLEAEEKKAQEGK